MAACLYYFKRLDNKLLSAPARNRIQLIEMKRIYPKLSVMLVCVDEKEYLLAQRDNNLALIEHNSTSKAEAPVD